MSSDILEVLKKPNRFVWVAGVTPLSGYGESAVITACYIVAIYSLQVAAASEYACAQAWLFYNHPSFFFP
jgi:hypothetical protein